MNLFRIFIFALGLICFSCSKEKVQEEIKLSNKDSVKQTDIIHEKKTDLRDTNIRSILDTIIMINKPDLKIEVWKGIENRQKYDLITKIKIYFKSTLKLIQEITDTEILNYQIKIADYNFDGYTDIYLHDNCMLLNNCSGSVLLFDPNIEKFVHAKEFDNLTTIEVDKKKKLIYSTNSSRAGAEFLVEAFKYNKKKLVLVERESQSGEPWGEIFYYTLEKRDSNGIMRTIKSLKYKDGRIPSIGQPKKDSND